MSGLIRTRPSPDRVVPAPATGGSRHRGAERWGPACGAAVPPAATRGSTVPAWPAPPPSSPNLRPPPSPSPCSAPLSPARPRSARAPLRPRPAPLSEAPAAPAFVPLRPPRGLWGRPRATDPRLGCICSTSCPAPTSSSARYPAASRPKSKNTSRWERARGSWGRGRGGWAELRGPEGGGGWVAESCVLRRWEPGPDFGVSERAGREAPLPGGSPGTGAGGRSPGSLSEGGPGAWTPQSHREGTPGFRELSGKRASRATRETGPLSVS